MQDNKQSGGSRPPARLSFRRRCQGPVSSRPEEVEVDPTPAKECKRAAALCDIITKAKSSSLEIRFNYEGVWLRVEYREGVTLVLLTAARERRKAAVSGQRLIILLRN